MTKSYVGAVETQPIALPIDWKQLVTKELPRKCAHCHWVYPSDHEDAPISHGDWCVPCKKKGKDV